jgi:hypothetical protein
MFRNLEELLTAAPTVLEEMVREFVRIANVHGQADKQSQATACSLLAIRSVSLLCSMGLLLRPSTLDGYDVLARSFLESRDLLTTFRFDNEGARKQIHAWFAGKEGWKPKHKICEEFVMKIGGSDPEFARRWGIFSGLSHPTARAAENSGALTAARLNGTMQGDDLLEMMRPKVADYLTDVASLAFAATFDFAEWIPLGCDLNHIPTTEQFRIDTAAIAVPILEMH